MSSKAVVFWLMLAVAFGVAAVVLLRVPSTPSGGTDTATSTATGIDQPVAARKRVIIGDRLMDFSASQIQSVKVIRPGGAQEIIEKAPGGTSILGSDAEWQLRMVAPSATAAGSPREPWPLNGPQVISVLRILAELTAAADPGVKADLTGIVTEIVITTGAGDRRLRLSDRTLAGTCLAEVSGGPHPPVRALIDSRVQDLFTNPGPQAWRETLVLAGLAGDASRITLENDAHTLMVAKLDGRWSLREPVSAPADASAVQKLIAELGRIRIVDFLDDAPPAASTGLDKPIASLSVEVDRRTFDEGTSDAKVTTAVCHLRVGSASDAGHSRLFASIGSGTPPPGKPERIVLVDARGLADISMSPAGYVWPHPSRQSATDVGAIVLDAQGDKGLVASKAFKRSLSRWSQVRADGADVALADRDLREVDALLGFLTGGEKGAFSGSAGSPGVAGAVGGSQAASGGAKVTLEPPEGLRVVGKATLLSVAGDTLETMELALSRGDQIVIRTGPIYREFSASRVPSLLMQVVRTGVPSPASAPTSTPAPASTPAPIPAAGVEPGK